MKRIAISLFDKKHEFKENIKFIKQVTNSSVNGLFISIIFILSLVAIDYFAKVVTHLLCDSKYNTLNSIADSLFKLNIIIGVKFLDYFRDVIVIVAGVLGVIFGLFYTSFLNLITSKYSDINSEIINQLIEQKIINKYFKLLAVLVSSSIIFQLLLTFGYNPTFLSCFIFTIIILLTLLSFTFFGRFSLIYFNASNVVLDLINSNYHELNRAYRNKKYFINDHDGYKMLYKLRQNINKISIIVNESNKPQFTNTNLKSISNQLLKFSLYYNQLKQTFPSNKGWHPKIQRYKKWDEATTSDYQLTTNTRAFLFPETFDEFNYLEKQIIETQFLVFQNIEKTNEKVQIINNQDSYLQTIAFQCEEDLFDTFFNELESSIKNDLIIGQNELSEDNLLLISIYANLIIQYLVGFNHNFDRIVTSVNLKKLAKAVHFFENTDNVMSIPYNIRKWIDKFQTSLLVEKYNDEKISTPLFYTEFELAKQIQLTFKTHIEKISDKIYERTILFSKHLKDSNLKIESLEFQIQMLDAYNKIVFFSEVIENRITTDINLLNLKKEKEFSFAERKGLIERSEDFKKHILKEIWNLGHSSYSIDNKNIPDIYGNFYQLICDDILEKAFANHENELAQYLPKFCTYNILYLENLKAKIDNKRIEYTMSKMYPIIVDLFEICSIAILLFKANKNQNLEQSFFDFWNNIFEKDEKKEKAFWSYIIPIYEYFNQPLFGLSTPSYVREHKRSKHLEKYLRDSDLLKTEEKEGDFMFSRYFVTDVNDIYFKEIIKGLGVDRYTSFGLDDLSEIFIEYFLRTRISLKDLNIKETTYGSNLTRYMEGDTE